MATSIPTVTIVILNYNTEHLLRNVLQSIKDRLQQNWRVVVVDNASEDGSVAVVKREFPFVSLIRNEKNIGYAAGNNVALRQVETDYVMLLNSDAEFIENTNVDAMLSYMQSHKKVAVLTPKVLLREKKIDPACHRGIPTPWNSLMYFSKMELLFGWIPFLNKLTGGYHQTWKDRSTVHEIDVCSGACMIVRTAAMKEVGVFDEAFFFYGEDIDWCVTFKEKGWKIVYFPKSEVLHHKRQSGIGKKEHTDKAKKIKEHAKSHFFDTMEIFYRKHYTHVYPRWVMSLVLFGIKCIKSLKGA